MSPYLTKAAVFAVVAAAGFLVLSTTDAFIVTPNPTSSSRSRCITHITTHSDKSSTSLHGAVAAIHDGIVINDKIELRDAAPEERGKGGVHVVAKNDDDDEDGGSAIKALEVLARIPRNLVLASVDMSPRVIDAVVDARNITWATELTAVALAALHPTEEEEEEEEEMASSRINDNGAIIKAKREWIQSWQTGGWGSDTDLGPDIAGDVVGTLLATGSDNDHNIYAKFRMSCHPAILKASLGLEFLTKCTAEEARAALTARGFTYRSMRDALQGLVLESTERTNRGTARDKRCWDVADMLDRVLARATTLQLDEDGTSAAACHAIVPIHEHLAHSLNANTKLVSIDDEVLLVATRNIEASEAITRDYTLAPRIESSLEGKGSALRLLLQFGLPPSAWPESQ